MNIAVCDDDTGMIETLTAMLYETADIHGLSIRCSIFFDGMSLIEAVKGQGIYFDLYGYKNVWHERNTDCTGYKRYRCS